MQILTFTRDDKEVPAKIGEEFINVEKILKYLNKTKDESFLRDTAIERVEIYDDTWLKIHPRDGEAIMFDFNKIDWLRTHQFIMSAKYHLDEVKRFWGLIKENIDMFLVEDSSVKEFIAKLPQSSKSMIDGVTYDRENVFVNGINTYIKFTYELFRFVAENKSNWQQ